MTAAPIGAEGHSPFRAFSVEAIAECWARGESTAALLPALKALLALGEPFTQHQDEAEEVSDSVYVMF